MVNNEMYIDLMKKVLVDYNHIEFDEYKSLETILEPSWKIKLLKKLDHILLKRDFTIRKRVQFRNDDRINGRDWPSQADTMIGMKRLENLELCIRNVIHDKIEGDLIETGVWRGGATIFMRALLKILGDNSRVVWVADSFEGLPEPNKNKYTADKNDEHYTVKELAVSIETVKNNFKKYDLLDEKVKFLKGWFKDTLPTAPIEKLSVLRLDGDMYESTMDALQNLYPKLSTGGYIIIDDWNAVRGCKQAVNDYRSKHGIREEIIPIDWSGVYWRKSNS